MFKVQTADKRSCSGDARCQLAPSLGFTSGELFFFYYESQDKALSPLQRLLSKRRHSLETTPVSQQLLCNPSTGAFLEICQDLKVMLLFRNGHIIHRRGQMCAS